MEFDLENPLTTAYDDDDHSKDSIAALFAAERDHVSSASSAGLLDISVRRDAVSFILQAQYARNLDPFIAYLAINYADRFLSKKQIPKGKPWIVRLLSISCLSLASKMKKTDFSIADIQMEEGFIYDAKTVGRMELMVLGALDWRMRSITPFSFLRFFLILFSPDHPPHIAALKERAIDTILKAQIEIKMMQFKPSEIAAAALLSTAHELFPVQFASFNSAVASCEFVNNKSMPECYNTMRELAADGGDSASDTPVTVLHGGHHHHHHNSSTESGQTVEHNAGDGEDVKKRRSGGGAAASFHFRRPYN